MQSFHTNHSVPEISRLWFMVNLVTGVFLIHMLAYTQENKTSLHWYPATDFTIQGRGWKETPTPYDRLPTNAQDPVPPPVWQLSQQSAGISVCFTSNSPEIHVRYTLRFNNQMPHMTTLGIKGLDLYAWSAATKTWQWAGNSKTNQKGRRIETVLIKDMDNIRKAFRLYLPLYDGIDSLFLGITSAAKITPLHPNYAMPNPLVFYGTSITQGGCASRPGMAYPALLGRMLNLETINLGFSGHGRMELELAALLSEIEACGYVIDCLPNMTPEMVAKRVVPFVEYIHQQRPTSPIILINSILYTDSWIKPDVQKLLTRKNQNLQKAYQQLKAHGVENVWLLAADELFKTNSEATVDGVHLTDLGFMRFSEHLYPQLDRILLKLNK